MTKHLKLSDLTIALCGALVSIVFYIVLASASTKWLMFVGKYQFILFIYYLFIYSPFISTIYIWKIKVLLEKGQK